MDGRSGVLRVRELAAVRADISGPTYSGVQPGARHEPLPLMNPRSAKQSFRRGNMDSPKIFAPRSPDSHNLPGRADIRASFHESNVLD